MTWLTAPVAQPPYIFVFGAHCPYVPPPETPKARRGPLGQKLESNPSPSNRQAPPPHDPVGCGEGTPDLTHAVPSLLGPIRIGPTRTSATSHWPCSATASATSTAETESSRSLTRNSAVLVGRDTVTPSRSRSASFISLARASALAAPSPPGISRRRAPVLAFRGRTSPMPSPFRLTLSLASFIVAAYWPGEHVIITAAVFGGLLAANGGGWAADLRAPDLSLPGLLAGAPGRLPLGAAGGLDAISAYVPFLFLSPPTGVHPFGGMGTSLMGTTPGGGGGPWVRVLGAPTSVSAVAPVLERVLDAGPAVVGCSFWLGPGWP